MRGESGKTNLCSALAIGMIVLGLGAAAQGAPKYAVLHSFGSGTDGGGLWGSVTLDEKGRVNGATSGGGDFNGGIVFRLTPQPNGEWSEKILHSFPDSHDDAGDPNGGLIEGKSGHWYGTSQYGGTLNGGTVFELKHTPSGWEENVLYSFGTHSDDGYQPAAGLVMDDSGNLYGTAAQGGSTAFQLSPGPDGWQETTLHHFGVENGDGAAPYAGLIRDAAGNLYGTTYGGGKGCAGGGCGTVYKLKPLGDGSWKETVLHRFNNDGIDGYTPGHGALAMDSAGNLYGTTEVGGLHQWGIVYRLKRQSDGHWKEKILHNFRNGKNGGFPASGVVVDGAGNLFGTTVDGGTGCACGVIYQLTPGPNDTCTYTVLHRFLGGDGAIPGDNLVLDGKGNLYGVTVLGGEFSAGVVFELTP